MDNAETLATVGIQHTVRKQTKQHTQKNKQKQNTKTKNKSNQHEPYQLVLETLSCLSRNRILYTVQFVDKRLTGHDKKYWYLRPLSTIFYMHSGKQQEYPYETNPLS